MTDSVQQEHRYAVLLLTLNRPEKLNALNLALAEALVDALDVAEAVLYAVTQPPRVNVEWIRLLPAG